MGGPWRATIVYSRRRHRRPGLSRKTRTNAPALSLTRIAMTRRFPAAWVCLLLSTSVFAAPLAQPQPQVGPPDAPSAASGTTRLHARPGVEIVVGGVRVELEKTTLVDLQKAAGGTITRSG